MLGFLTQYFWELFVPSFFLMYTIILRLSYRIRFDSGTDAIAVVGALDAAASAGKLNFVKAYGLDITRPGAPELFFGLMFASIAAMVLSAWAESALQEGYSPLRAAARQAAVEGNMSLKHRYLAELVGRQLLAYMPAVFILTTHVVAIIRLSPNE